MNGSCCGEGDGYPAVIDEEATPEHAGSGHVLDPSGKEIWVNGYVVKVKPPLHGDLTFTFDYNHVTKEQLGNPFDYAMVFLHTNLGEIERNIYPFGGVYCVVMPMRNF